MKTPKEFSKHYLSFILGGRKECNVLEYLDEEIQKEIIKELADLIEERDGENKRQYRKYR